MYKYVGTLIVGELHYRLAHLNICIWDASRVLDASQGPDIDRVADSGRVLDTSRVSDDDRVSQTSQVVAAGMRHVVGFLALCDGPHIWG